MSSVEIFMQSVTAMYKMNETKLQQTLGWHTMHIQKQKTLFLDIIRMASQGVYCCVSIRYLKLANTDNTVRYFLGFPVNHQRLITR